MLFFFHVCSGFLHYDKTRGKGCMINLSNAKIRIGCLQMLELGNITITKMVIFLVMSVF